MNNQRPQHNNRSLAGPRCRRWISTCTLAYSYGALVRGYQSVEHVGDTRTICTSMVVVVGCPEHTTRTNRSNDGNAFLWTRHPLPPYRDSLVSTHRCVPKPWHAWCFLSLAGDSRPLIRPTPILLAPQSIREEASSGVDRTVPKNLIQVLRLPGGRAFDSSSQLTHRASLFLALGSGSLGRVGGQIGIFVDRNMRDTSLTSLLRARVWRWTWEWS